MRWRWTIGIAVLCTVVVLAVGVHAQPAIAAMGCPQCFGFERIGGFGDRIFADRDMPPAAQLRLESSVGEAQRAVVSFFGGAPPDPVVLACWTESCYQSLGTSGARGVAYGSYGLRLDRRGLDAVIISHEYTHIELHQRIGMRHMFFGGVPAWFDEGLAVVVSDDRRYLLPEGVSGSRCRVAARDDLPVTQKEWVRQAGRVDTAYASAACRVWSWMDANGGRDAVLRLIRGLAAGRRFSDLYRDPRS